MSILNNIISFYRECYQHDLKGIRITNFLSKQVSKRYAPKSNEFFHNYLEQIPIDSSWAKAVEKELLLNSKEKALYAGTFFIKGQRNLLGKVSNSTLPLYIHELEIAIIDDVYFIGITDTYLNPDFLSLINTIDKDLNWNWDFIEQHLPSNPFSFENIVLISQFFETHLPVWDKDELSNYHDPNFNFDKHLSTLKNAKIGVKKIFSSLIFGIIKKPAGSLGVMSELNALDKTKANSVVLKQFFGLEEIPNTELKSRQIYVPASLSSSQKGSIFKSEASSISMILGPPGTGKSFTIACLVLDAICHNKSVLVVSKNKQATRVISNIIENDFKIKGRLVKADNQVYKRGLAARLSKLIYWSKEPKQDLNKLKNKILLLFSEIDDIFKELTKAEKNEIEWGKFYHDNKKGFFSKLKDKWIQYQKSNAIPVWRLNELLIRKINKKNKDVKSYIRLTLSKKLNDTLIKRRSSFSQLVNALEESNFTKLDEKIQDIDFDLILTALPIWLTTSKDISRHLPLQRELFDLVIVDEASQCDIATTIPIMQRAKKLIVVGDPQQLNHISFLSDKKQKSLLDKYDLNLSLPDYRRESLIDWTHLLLKSQDQVTFLNDHYRSKTDIIQFSNERFYNNKLNIIRSNPLKQTQKNINIQRVSGTRDKRGQNIEEAKAILNELNKIISKFADADKSIIPSIGIASPSNAQTRYLKSYLLKEISTDSIKKHKLLIGTPFHFQGEERDIMLISFAIDNDAHFASVNYLNKEDVFNVLITRARNSQLLFISFEPNELPPASLLRSYLDYSQDIDSIQNENYVYDEFMDEVILFLNNKGFENITKAIIIAGVKIDLTVVQDKQFFCIDLIGYPGDFEEQFTKENILMLNRMNIPVFFVSYSSWVLNNKKTRKELIKYLTRDTIL